MTNHELRPTLGSWSYLVSQWLEAEPGAVEGRGLLRVPHPPLDVVKLQEPEQSEICCLENIVYIAHCSRTKLAINLGEVFLDADNLYKLHHPVSPSVGPNIMDGLLDLFLNM